ncbi:MAG: hypothetical protein AAF399_12455 [Bacteroidota bacterium]
MKSLVCLFTALLMTCYLYANSSLWEGLGLDLSNQLRLQCYAEMLGQVRSDRAELRLGFGSLGSFQLYPTHCLLKTARGQCLTVDRHADRMADQVALNEALSELLEQIDLMGQEAVEVEKREYVDQALAGLSLGAFEKLYVRHLLLQYGRWDRRHQSVWLHSDWLSEQQQAPLALQLNQTEARGFFLEHGGQVYAGTQTRANGAAFELFLYQLMSREVRRVGKKTPASGTGISPLYGPDNWIPMMLGQLRAHGINVGDPDVICHFRAHPDFPKLLAQMTEDERSQMSDRVAVRSQSYR